MFNRKTSFKGHLVKGHALQDARPDKVKMTRCTHPVSLQIRDYVLVTIIFSQATSLCAKELAVNATTMWAG